MSFTHANSRSPSSQSGTGVLSERQRRRQKRYFWRLALSPQARADRAIGVIIGAIQNIALAIDDASIAIMYHIPAENAEPDRGLDRLHSAERRLTRALYLISDAVQREDQKRPELTVGRAP
jgi:hypothetical protein